MGKSANVWTTSESNFILSTVRSVQCRMPLHNNRVRWQGGSGCRQYQLERIMVYFLDFHRQENTMMTSETLTHFRGRDSRIEVPSCPRSFHGCWIRTWVINLLLKRYSGGWKYIAAERMSWAGSPALTLPNDWHEIATKPSSLRKKELIWINKYQVAYAHAEVHFVVLAKEVWIHPGAILGGPDQKRNHTKTKSASSISKTLSTCRASHPAPSSDCSPCAPNHLRAPSGQICTSKRVYFSWRIADKNKEQFENLPVNFPSW